MSTSDTEDVRRLTLLSIIFALLALIIIGRLFYLQIMQYDYYSTMALNSHEIYEKIHPDRGQIFFKSAKDGSEPPAAINTIEYLLYAVPNEIKKEKVLEIVDELSQALSLGEEEKNIILEKISKNNDPYEALAKRITEQQMANIKSFAFEGIHFTPGSHRFYPEGNLLASVLGFYGFDAEGNPKGSYGLEGYWEKDLAGKSGLMLGEKGALGSWITLAGRITKEAENGADLVLTIDRALEYQACERLRQGFKEFKAKSASLVMVEVNSGSILAMCSFPDFDPNNYSKVSNVSAYNNTTIFTPYEPGSVFKPITMSIGLDLDLVSPNTTFTDPCVRKMNGREIHNALNKCYGQVNMTEVLENSINTGVVWVEEKVASERFKKYVEKYGFGQKTGITLETEAAGNIDSLTRKGGIWGANASFGQGISATPLQLAMAYSAIANGGKLYKPYIVSEEHFSNGKIERTKPEIVEQVISQHASKLLIGMLVSVVENGHSQEVRSENYYLAGKTGTAQIAGPGGYLELATNHTFAGFGPASNPRLALVVKYEQPQRDWADSTAGTVFKEVMEYALHYLGVPEDR